MAGLALSQPVACLGALAGLGGGDSVTMGTEVLPRVSSESKVGEGGPLLQWTAALCQISLLKGKGECLLRTYYGPWAANMGQGLDLSYLIWMDLWRSHPHFTDKETGSRNWSKCTQVCHRASNWQTHTQACPVPFALSSLPGFSCLPTPTPSPPLLPR